MQSTLTKAKAKAKERPPDRRDASVSLPSSMHVSRYHGFGKRLFDVAAGSALLMVLFPVIAVCAICALIDAGWPAFYNKARIGRDAEPFTCFKLRTMRPESSGLSHAQRITRFGAFARKWHLDELPQLWNVVRGEMSLVGPRPHTPEDTARFSAMHLHYDQRHAIRPGITGLAQVRGFFGYVDSEDHLNARVSSDVEYVQSATFTGDMTILLRTLSRPTRKSS